MQLRGASTYSIASETNWMPSPEGNSIHRNAGIVAACCSSIGICCLLNVILRRIPWDILRSPGRANCSERISAKRDRSKCGNLPHRHDGETSPSYSNPCIEMSLPAYGSQTPRSVIQTPAPVYDGSLGQCDMPRTPSLASIPQTSCSKTNFKQESDNLNSLEQVIGDTLNKTDEISYRDYQVHVRTQPHASFGGDAITII